MSGCSEPTELIARKESANIIPIFYSAIALLKITNPHPEQNKFVSVQPSGHIVNHFIKGVNYTLYRDCSVNKEYVYISFQSIMTLNELYIRGDCPGCAGSNV